MTEPTLRKQPTAEDAVSHALGEFERSQRESRYMSAAEFIHELERRGWTVTEIAKGGDA